MRNGYKKVIVITMAAFFLPTYLNKCFSASGVNTYTPNIYISAPTAANSKTIPAAIRGVNQAASTSMNYINNSAFAPNLIETNAGAFRWPDGNFANGYQWRKDLENSSIFNLKNASAFTKTYSLTLQVVLNYGNTNANQAADYVRFCNSTIPYWNDQRQALLGDPAPLNVKIWEIGNEIGTSYGWAYSWFGHPKDDLVHFRTGTPDKIYSQRWADSLYYYGGTANREGWVTGNEEQSKWDNLLGDKVFRLTGSSTFTVDIVHPKLPSNNNRSLINVYVIPGITKEYIETVSTQEAYDNLTNPSFKLSTAKYSVINNDSDLVINNTIPAGSLIYVEYPSSGHSGAFAIRNSMMAADPTIKVGYCVDFMKNMISGTNFRTKLSASPPAFMIEHNYPSRVTIDMIDNQNFTTLANFPGFIRDRYVRLQSTLDSIRGVLGITPTMGVGITEWNIGLWGEAPLDYGYYGIAGAMYNASYRGYMFESLINNSIQLEALDQFACLASGNSFLHQFHIVNVTDFEIESSGYATQLFGQAINGKIFMPDSITNDPGIIESLYPISLPTIKTWLGYNPTTKKYGMLILNMDAYDTTIVTINSPAPMGKVFWNCLEGENVNTNVLKPVSSSTITATSKRLTIKLPPYSINSFVIPGKTVTGKMEEESTGIIENGSQENAFIFPNPAFEKLYITSTEKISSIKITDIFGAEVISTAANSNEYRDISQISAGLYLIHLHYENGSREIKKFVKR